MREHYHEQTLRSEMPIVSTDVAHSLSRDLQRDPEFKERLHHIVNEENSDFLKEIVIEAFRRSDGIKDQEAFVDGALFALGGVKKQLDTDTMRKLFSIDEKGIVENSEASDQPKKQSKVSWLRKIIEHDTSTAA